MEHYLQAMQVVQAVGTDKNTINYGLRSVFNTKISMNNGATLSGITGIETQRQDANVVGFNMKADPNDPNPTTWVYGVSPYWVINANTSNTAFVSTTGSLFTEWTLSLKNYWRIYRRCWRQQYEDHFT